jgi:hypothetical protein
MNQHSSEVFSRHKTLALRPCVRREQSLPNAPLAFAKVRSTSERICVQAASNVRALAKLLYLYDLSLTNV